MFNLSQFLRNFEKFLQFFVLLLFGFVFLMKSIMVQAKKAGHFIYSFIRKKDLFDQLSTMITTTGKDKKNYMDNILFEMNKLVLTRNMSQLSLFFETMNSYEKFVILKNEAKIKQFFKQNDWSKGLKLYQLVIDQCSSN